MITAPNLSELSWLSHGFGDRDSVYPGQITTARQIHSCIVLEVGGAGGDRIADGDGLVTGQPGMLVGVRTADCVPILLADRVRRVVSAVHAGWRGTAAGIAGEAVLLMEEKFGTRPGDVVAAIGPSIGGCCYEVGADVARHFGTWLPDLEQTATVGFDGGPERARVDLKTVNRLQLQQLGIQNVWVSPNCTYCCSGFYSFRRDKEQAGRMISYIGTA